MKKWIGQKEYDRQRAKRLYADYKQRRQLLIQTVFDNQCYLCSSQDAIRFDLHHVIYDEIESNYTRNGRNFSDRLKRLKEAENHPERFKLLCSYCHIVLEGIKRQSVKMNLSRLLELLDLK